MAGRLKHAAKQANRFQTASLKFNLYKYQPDKSVSLNSACLDVRNMI